MSDSDGEPIEAPLPGRSSPLDDRHRALGASLTDFGGWQMPLDYGSVVAEHRAVRESCGLFDLSHLGTVTVTGGDAEAVVQHAFTGDASTLAVGGCQYTLCLNDAAGIVDDLILSRFSWGFWVMPNAANAGAVMELLRRSAAGRDADVVDVKADTACLAVQGPGSVTMLLESGIDVGDLAYMTGRPLDMASPSGVAPGESADVAPSPGGGGVVTRTGYTGEVGFEVVVPVDRAPDLWDKLTAAGARPAGLGARDTLRLEMGYPLHGQDISSDTTPVPARLGWAVKPGTGFRGEAAYVAAKEAGADVRLWGLRATGRGIPRARQMVRRGGTDVGVTTSGTFSPTCKLGIALGYLDAAVVEGDSVEIDVRGRALSAEVVRPPFVDADPRG